MLEKIAISIFGYTVGIISSSLLFGKIEGVSGLLPNVRFSVGDFHFSPHHWAVYILPIIILMIIQAKWHLFPNEIYYFLTAFMIGTVNQGLLYNDWYIWIRKL